MGTVFISKNGKSIKIVNDGIDVIGKLQSCSGRKDGLSVFVDSSIGCNNMCSYCQLTKEERQYIKIDNNLWIKTFDELINQFNETDIHLKFMGQGDAFSEVDDTIKRIEMVKSKYNVKSVSLSTILPSDTRADIPKLLNYRNNDGTYYKFYISLGSCIPSKRKEIFPSAIDLETTFSIFKEFNIHPKTHWTISDDMDIENELENFPIKLLRYTDIRIIPYNNFNTGKTDIKNLKNVKEFFKVKNIYYDILPVIAPDINASCGMF